MYPSDPAFHPFALFEQLFEHAPVFMAFTSGPEHRFERINLGAYQLLKKDSSILGRPVADVFPELVTQGFVDLLNEVYRTGKAFYRQEALVHFSEPSGGERTRYCDFVYQPLFDEKGAVYGILHFGTDVTEKVLARRAIEVERGNFRNLFRQTPEMVCILAGPEHVFEFVNEAYVKALGFDATGKKVREAQPESVEVHGILDAVYHTGITAELRELPVTLTDRVRYFNLTYAARRDAFGRIDGIMILGIEVTDEVLARRNLERKTAELESLISHSPIGIAFLDRQHRYLRVNQRLADFNGVPVDAHPNHRIEDIVPKNAPGIIPLIDKVFSTGESIQIEFSEDTPRHHGNDPTWVVGFYPVRGHDGTVASVGAYVLDVTEQRKVERAVKLSEEQFRVLANSIPQIVWTTDPGGKLSFLNERWLEYTGAGLEVAELDGGMQFIHPEDRSTVSAAWEHALRDQDSFEFEARFQSKEGDYEWFLVQASPVKDGAGRVLKWFGTNTNVEEQRRTREELEGALRTRDEFLSIASHELRTPVTPIKLQVQMLMRFAKSCSDPGALRDRIQRTSEVVNHQTNRLAALVDDLLDVSRIRTGRLKINAKRVDLSALAVRVLDNFRPQLAAVRCSIREEIRKGIFAEVDEDRIEQVLANLFGNVIKYAPGSQITFRVCEHGGAARMELEDQGPGIPDKTIIFERFERANADHSKISGLGLGLYISKQIVETHKGRIFAEDGARGGSRFVVELPREPAEGLTPLRQAL